MENALKEWHEIWHADISLTLPKFVRFLLMTDDFSNFGTILT